MPPGPWRPSPRRTPGCWRSGAPGSTRASGERRRGACGPYKSRTWGSRSRAAPPRIRFSLLDGPGVHVLEPTERRVRERAHRAIELVGPPRGQRGELVQRQPDGVLTDELADLMDQVESLRLVGRLVGLVHEVRG